MKNWIRERKALVTQIKVRIEAEYGAESITVAEYANRFFNIFKKSSPKISSKTELLKYLGSESVEILIGTDFHSYDQSQKAHLRVLRSLTRPAVILLECFDVKDQRHIDAFLRSQMSEEQFLEQVKWKKKWGFPWDHYKDFFILAREKDWKIKGMNSHSASSSRKGLAVRDRYMARQIAETYQTRGKSIIYCVVGEFHSAPEHLPSEITKIIARAKVALLFVNPESLLERHFNIVGESIFRVSENAFAILNSSSLVKWHSYLVYLQKQDEFINHFEHQIDYAEHIYEIEKILCRILERPTPNSLHDVYSSIREVPRNRWNKLQPSEKLNFKLALKYGEVGVSSQFAMVFKAKFNHMSELAALLLMTSTHNSTISFNPKNMEHKIWIQSWAYFFSKLLNPNRRARGIDEMLEKKKVPYKSKLKILAFCMQMRITSRSKNKNQFDFLNSFIKLNDEEAFVCVRLLGELYGGQLFDMYSRKEYPMSFLNELSKQRIDDKDFSLIFFKFVSEIVLPDSIPEFKSANI